MIETRTPRTHAARRHPHGIARALVLLCLLGWLHGCATPGGPPQATEEERLAFGEALASLPEDPATARAALERFLAEQPDSPLADDAGEKLAALALGAGDREAAVRWLEFVVTRHPRGDRADPARLALAGIARDAGDTAAARNWLQRTRFSNLTPAQQAVGYRMLADLAPTPAQRLRWLGQLYAVTPEEGDRARVDAEIDEGVAQLAVDTMRRMAPSFDGRVPAARLRLRLAERALDAGDTEQAERDLAAVAQMERTPRDDALAREIARRLSLRHDLATAGVLPTFEEVAALPPPRTDGAVGTLGVVLPLTGSFAHYGEESLRGILLAAGVFAEPGGASAAIAAAGDPAGRSRVRLVVRDSGGSPERAAAAVRELAAQDEVVAIVGPLLAAEAEAAAGIAEREGIPLLTLTSREEVAAGRPHVFRLRTTPRDEVRFLVERAIDALEARRFAVLYPGDSYGRGMREHFWRAVEERGGHIVAASSYPPDATDFAAPIRRMVGFTLLTDDERAAIAEREEKLREARRLPPEESARVREALQAMRGPDGRPLPPIVDFDALFIPDSHEKIVLIAPQLAFHDVTGVTLLGSSGWAHPDLVRIGRNHVRGAVFTALFHPESRYTFVSDFVDRYAAHYEAEPDVFSATAYDAANLVLVQLAAGHEEREAVRDGIVGTHAYPGASGVTSVLPDGNARKRPFLLGVRGNRIVALD